MKVGSVIFGGIYLSFCFLGKTYLIKKFEGQNLKKGYYNREIKDPRFLAEFFKEIGQIDKFYHKDFKSNTKNVVTIDILIDPSVKLFYDDAVNEGDNSDWVDHAKKSLGGLGYFNEFTDLEFKINSVKGVYVPKLHQSFNDEGDEESKFYSTVGYLNSVKGNYDSDILILLMGGEEIKNLLGAVNGINGDACFVTMTNNDELNKSVIAHEVGHLFGAMHQGIFLYEWLYAPSFGKINYGVDIMTPGNLIVANWSSSTKKTIEENKHRFRHNLKENQ